MAVIFTTARMVVRELEPKDIELFHDLHSNPNVMQYTSGKIRSLEEDEEDLSQIIGSYSDNQNTKHIWALAHPETNEFIGTCAVIGSENEIGYRIREAYWNKGFGKEIANGLINFCIEELKVKSITAFSFADNEASVKILDASKLDFIKEFFDNEYCMNDRYYRWTAE